MTTRVLMLTHRVPYPPDRGDRIRSWHLLRELSKHAAVDLACVSEQPVSAEQREALRSYADRVAICETSAWSGRLRGGVGLLRGQAVTPAVFHRGSLHRQVASWHQQRPFDAVLTFCTGMMRYSKALYESAARPPRRHVLDLVDVDSLKWHDYARTSRAPLRWVYATEAQRLREVEAGRRQPFDFVSVISHAEARRYLERVSQRRRVIVAGNGVDLDRFAALPYVGGQSVVFVGVLDYRPNVEAVTWFADAVLPALRQRAPGTRFVVVGRNPAAQVRRLAEREGVQVAGSVPDVRPYLAEAAAVVAPLRIAPGVQNKVLEAMASARPVVCSPSAASGIDAEPGRHLLVADTASQYVDHLVQLLEKPAAAEALGLAARQQVQEAYDWSQRLAPLVETVTRAGQPAWLQSEHLPLSMNQAA